MSSVIENPSRFRLTWPSYHHGMCHLKLITAQPGRSRSSLNIRVDFNFRLNPSPVLSSCWQGSAADRWLGCRGLPRRSGHRDRPLRLAGCPGDTRMLAFRSAGPLVWGRAAPVALIQVGIDFKMRRTHCHVGLGRTHTVRRAARAGAGRAYLRSVRVVFIMRFIGEKRRFQSNLVESTTPVLF